LFDDHWCFPLLLQASKKGWFAMASISGDNAANLLLGTLFDDQISGRQGDDTIKGGAGKRQHRGG
jgi:Ca2+-binding RTX toxin-like protein